MTDTDQAARDAALASAFEGSPYAGAPLEAAKAGARLGAAIARLGAVEVAPGRYAFPSKVAPRWFTCDEANVALCEPASAVYFAPVDAGRSFFGCNLTPCVLMPAWWAPDRREAWRNVSEDGDNGERYTSRADAREDAQFDVCRPRTERITADLTTGAEVPA